MKRTLLLVIVAFCAACTAPPDSSDTGQPGGSSDEVSQPSDEAQPGDETQPPDEPQPDVTPAVEGQPSDEPEPADAGQPSDGPDVAGDSEPGDDPQPSEGAAAAVPTIGIVAEEPADGPFVKTEQGFMVPYTTTIPGTDVEFEMIPIPGGKFIMGSPDSEADRRDDEGPQFEVEVPPFWMGKYEIRWAEYREFMGLVDTFIDFTSYKMRLVTDENRADAITAPSNLYDPSMTFDKGEDPELPAVTMTVYAAKQYTKWLSRITGQYFRLPTEAEWEYACRAGATTAYPFGDDPADLGDYAWYEENSDETPHKVGEKKPNAWGLYDMIGNVAELVLDEYREDGYEAHGGKTVAAADAVAWPTEYDNRVCRGGAWDDFEEDCRCAKRRATEGEDWKTEDPNEPKSPWWYADKPTLSIGFRIIRPLAPPTEEDLKKTWDPAVVDIQEAAEYRISEGRGAWGLVDPDLPDAIEAVKKKKAG
jgi:formylglycine-generating enzyme required for sulfatase activity